MIPVALVHIIYRFRIFPTDPADKPPTKMEVDGTGQPVCKNGHRLDYHRDRPALRLTCDACNYLFAPSVKAMCCAECDIDICSTCVDRMPEDPKRVPRTSSPSRPGASGSPSPRKTKERRSARAHFEKEEEDDDWAGFRAFGEKNNLSKQEMLMKLKLACRTVRGKDKKSRKSRGSDTDNTDNEDELEADDEASQSDVAEQEAMEVCRGKRRSAAYKRLQHGEKVR